MANLVFDYMDEEFLISEESGSISREAVPLVYGYIYDVGMLVAKVADAASPDFGKYMPLDHSAAQDPDYTPILGTDTAAGIIARHLHTADGRAGQSGPNSIGVIVARDAEVDGSMLWSTIFNGISPDITKVRADLAALGIVVRGELNL